MTNENTNTDEPSKAELHDRVEKLESTVAKMMPSRRDALKLGAAGIVGAAGLSATSQSAAASTGSAGQIGDSSNRPDIFADSVNANSLAGSVKNQGCRVFLSSDQNISQGPRPRVEFDRKEYDSGGNFDTSTHLWTCPESGIYLANLQLFFSGGGNSDDRRVIIGSDIAFRRGEGSDKRDRDSTTGSSMLATTVNKYDNGDKIGAYAENISSSDTIRGGSNDSFKSFFEVVYLGGL